MWIHLGLWHMAWLVHGYRCFCMRLHNFFNQTPFLNFDNWGAFPVLWASLQTRFPDRTPYLVISNDTLVGASCEHPVHLHYYPAGTSCSLRNRIACTLSLPSYVTKLPSIPYCTVHILIVLAPLLVSVVPSLALILPLYQLLQLQSCLPPVSKIDLPLLQCTLHLHRRCHLTPVLNHNQHPPVLSRPPPVSSTMVSRLQAPLSKLPCH